jgi:CSLREA domain-containing protein
MTRARLPALVGSAALVLLILVPSAFAKTYHPNKTGDSVPNGCSKSNCTLREAVIAANATTSSDKIILKAGKTYKLSMANAGGVPEDNGLTGDLDINGGGGSLKIQSDSSKKQAKVNAQAIDRVFDVGALTAVSASFKLLKISGGNTSAVGGAIHVAGGSAKLAKSTLAGNHAGVGGGIQLGDPAASVAVANSTISGNTADGNGGGLMIQPGNVSIVNSTIAGNTAAGTNGGGIRMIGGSLTLSSVTVARNYAAVGGGISASGLVNVMNSIIALNTGGVNPDCSGTFNSSGVNLLTNQTGCTGLNTPPNILTSDPKLGSLKKNGGPTKTIELKKGSPAINHAGAGSPKRDQRGEKRKKPDIGAFERT